MKDEHRMADGYQFRYSAESRKEFKMKWSGYGISIWRKIQTVR